MIIAIFLGMLGYSYTQIHVELNDVSFRSLDFVKLSSGTILKLGLNLLTGNWLAAAFSLIDGVNLNLMFGFSNGGILPLYIPNLSYDMSVNDVPVGKGFSIIDVVIGPGEKKEIPIVQNFKKSSFAPAIKSVIENGGVLEVKVRGTAYFKFLGLDIPIPFQSTKRISIQDEIKKRLNTEIQKNEQTSYRSDQTDDSLTHESGNEMKKISGIPDSPNADMNGQTIVDSVYRVLPGTYYYVTINLPCTTHIQGGFSTQAALGNNIIVYVFDSNQFGYFQSGKHSKVYYQSGKVESGRFELNLSSGEYYVVLSNTYSAFSTKNVALHVVGKCN